MTFEATGRFSTSFCQDYPARPAPRPAFDGDMGTDLLVVGGGYAGLWRIEHLGSNPTVGWRRQFVATCGPGCVHQCVNGVRTPAKSRGSRPRNHRLRIRRLGVRVSSGALCVETVKRKKGRLWALFSLVDSLVMGPGERPHGHPLISRVKRCLVLVFPADLCPGRAGLGHKVQLRGRRSPWGSRWLIRARVSG